MGRVQKGYNAFLKIFFLRMFTQGRGIADYDMKHIRIMGILQRVAVCYYIAALWGVRALLVLHTKKEEVRMSHLGVFKSTVALGRFASVHTVVQHYVWCRRSSNVRWCHWMRLRETYRSLQCTARRRWGNPGKDHMYYPSNGGDREGRNDVSTTSECSLFAGIMYAPMNANGMGCCIRGTKLRPLIQRGGVALLQPLGLWLASTLVEYWQSFEWTTQTTHYALAGPIDSFFFYRFAYSGRRYHATKYRFVHTTFSTGHQWNGWSIGYFLVCCYRRNAVQTLFYAIYLGGEKCVGNLYWRRKWNHTVVLGHILLGWRKNSLANLLWPGVFWGVQSSDLNRLTENTYDISVCYGRSGMFCFGY